MFHHSKKIWKSALCIALVLTIIFQLAGFQAGCAEIRQRVLRLHVIANSDSEADQAVKLLVRDAILQEGADLFDGSDDIAHAVARLAPNLDRLTAIANRVLAENGMDYTATVTLGESYFNTRTYGDFTLPAGRYMAVRVLLGEGVGHNWWCVMFPPLCLPAVQKTVALDAYLDKGQVKIVESNPKIEVRFKIVELVEELKESIRSRA